MQCDFTEAAVSHPQTDSEVNMYWRYKYRKHAYYNYCNPERPSKPTQNTNFTKIKTLRGKKGSQSYSQTYFSETTSQAAWGVEVRFPEKTTFFWKLSNFVNFAYFLLQFFLLGRKHSRKAIFSVFLWFLVFTCFSGAPTSDAFYTMYLQYVLMFFKPRIWHQEYLNTNKLC